MTRPFFLFAPGAGAPSSHPWMQRWKERLSALGDVVALDYSYMQQGQRRPDRLPQLIARHREALAEARRIHTGPAILIGKSMGGRIGCHVSLEEAVAVNGPYLLNVRVTPNENVFPMVPAGGAINEMVLRPPQPVAVGV